MYIFDFDGTLVDTKAAVIKAYTRAGINKTPEEWEQVWGRPWKDWLIGDGAKATHDRKNKLFADCMSGVRPLPLMAAALTFKAPVVTSASQAAVTTVMMHLMRYNVAFANLKIVLVGVDAYKKADYLDWASDENNMELFYVDDMPHIRDFMNERAKDKRWKAISPEECLTSLQSYLPQVKTLD